MISPSLPYSISFSKNYELTFLPTYSILSTLHGKRYLCIRTFRNFITAHYS